MTCAYFSDGLVQPSTRYSYGVADYSMEEAVKKTSLSSKSCAAMVHQVMRQTSFTCSPALSEKIRHLTESIPILGCLHNSMHTCVPAIPPTLLRKLIFLQCFFFQNCFKFCKEQSSAEYIYIIYAYRFTYT